MPARHATSTRPPTAAIGPRSGDSPSSPTRWIDPPTLMRIKSLQLRARVVVEGFYNGLHRSPVHGFSVEFSEYRQYTPGDDPRYLDWRLYARSDRYYIKRFEDETNLRCYLLVDLSRSMGFGSQAYDKAEYARTLAATLGYFLTTQRDSVGLATFADTLLEHLPARYRPGHYRRLLLALERSLTGQRTDLLAPLESLAQSVAKRGLMVYVSDLLAPVDQLQEKLGYLTSRGHEVVIFRILDPAEISFNFTAPAMFQDLETGRQLYVDPTTAREAYLRQFRQHREQVEQACAAQGVDLYTLATDQPLEMALFEFLQARLRRGRRAAIRGRSSSGRPR